MTTHPLPQPNPFPTPTAQVSRYSDELGSGWRVETYWPIEGLDRPNVHAYALGENEPLARRLARAINDGAVYQNPRILYDIYGHSYVEADAKVMGRYANADLRRLGY